MLRTYLLLRKLSFYPPDAGLTNNDQMVFEIPVHMAGKKWNKQVDRVCRGRRVYLQAYDPGMSGKRKNRPISEMVIERYDCHVVSYCPLNNFRIIGGGHTDF